MLYCLLVFFPISFPLSYAYMIVMLAFEMLFSIDLYQQVTPPRLSIRATGMACDQHEVYPALIAEHPWLEHLLVVGHNQSRNQREQHFVAGGP